MRISIPLQANVPLQQYFRGRCLAIMDTGAASEVEVSVFGASTQDVEEFGEVGRFFTVYDDRGITGAEFTSTVNTTIEIIVTGSRVEVIDGANLTVTIASQPIQVKPPTAAALTSPAGVAVGAALTALVGASAARTSVRFYNREDSTHAVTLGPAGHTWAKRCLVLQPGDTHIENDAANLAWNAITDAGGAATVCLQEVTV